MCEVKLKVTRAKKRGDILNVTLKSSAGFSACLAVVLTFMGGVVVPLEARILNVPGAYRTIQGAVDESMDGDTVLVAPGRYAETVEYSGRQITVASLLLTTGDDAYIDSTVIDGDSVDVCVAFYDAEGEGALLRGFTLTRGIQNFGGGIDVQQDAAPRLQDLRVTGNWAREIGGGIYCTWSSRPVIERVVVENNSARQGAGIGSAHEAHPVVRNSIIRDNTAMNEGGAVFCGHGDGEITLEHCLLTGNSAEIGSAVQFETSENNIISNCTIYGNSSDDGRGAISLLGYGEYLCDVTLRNNIIFSNGAPTITVEYDQRGDGNRLLLSYNDLQWGADSMLIDEGNRLEERGNTAADPLLADPDEGDFTLTFPSPCIDTGDPMADLDADSTRADIGAYPWLLRGVIDGYVRASIDGEPVPGATVSTDLYASAVSDDDGYYRIRRARAGGRFALTASAPAFNDSTIVDLELEPDDTVRQDFTLLSPRFRLAPDSLAVAVDTGGSAEREITLGNDGDGPLAWTVRPHNRGEAGAAPWELRRRMEIEDAVYDGVFYTRELIIFVAADWVRLYDWDSNLVGVFQFPRHRTVAWDGSSLWGLADSALFRVELDGDVTASFAVPPSEYTAMTYNDADSLIVAADADGMLHLFSAHNGNQAGTLMTELEAVRGLAWWADSAAGGLYIHHQAGDTLRAVVRMDWESGEAEAVWRADAGDSTLAGPAYITRNWDAVGSTVFTTLTRNPDGTQNLDVHQLRENLFWLAADQAGGDIEPGGETIITAHLTTVDPDRPGSGLLPGVYEGEFIFTHNAADGTAVLPVTLSVEEPDAVAREAVTPGDFSIAGVYPNPFNSLTRIRYHLPQDAQVTLVIYDLNGREVAVLYKGRMVAGDHEVTWDGKDISSGLYVCRLEAGASKSSVKLVLVK